MTIREITTDKKRYLDLLLIADEQESMIDRYLERGDMFVIDRDEGSTVAVAVVTVENDNEVELKNLAVSPEMQGKGYGKMMIEHICAKYSKRYHTLLVGTGETPSTIGFYEHCGFTRSHRIAGFFTDNYDHPIIEDGILLTDMVYLKRRI